ncbi:PREDICTED: reticulon-like protein B17 [Camelina sativa]|uniref:Reticulon-like protein n=1 Tax=Camelina sativa TaxID=90675 RepID=A0ABM0W9W5_CAMSA|nr:PREDICTED: reticulon-like protein B17 [Camelina sativa]
MESSCTPPPYHRLNTIRSASRLARVGVEDQEEAPFPNNLSLDLVLLPSSPKSNHTPNPSPVSSPIRLADRLEMASEDAANPAAAAAVVVRKRGKGKGGQKGLLLSPRNPRRSRRRSEAVEEKEANLMMIDDESIVKPRKRKTNGRPKKDKRSLLAPPCSSNASQSDLNRIGEIISDLVMWRDAAKSTLWFGFGCLSFLSSCFAKGVNFSVFSVASNLGLVLLCWSFLSNTLCQRKIDDTKRAFHVTEDDVLRLSRRVLPAANFFISKASEVFSGEPSMTLKVTPFLLLGAEYGHLITLWRLSAFGFFLSFTIPKLYSCYTHQISQKVERVTTRIGEAWGVCSHKKILAASAVTAFWNLTSIRTRIFAVFIILVIFRYRRQNLEINPEEVKPVENEKPEEETLPQEEEEETPPQEEDETVPQEEVSVPQEEEQIQPSEERALVAAVAETEGSKKL